MKITKTKLIEAVEDPEKVIDDMQLGIDKVKKIFKNNKDTKIISDRY